MADTGYLISDLRHQPQLISTVAQRVWQAWWAQHGVSLSYIESRVQENFGSNGVPFALVAHRSTEFLGTVSVVDCDMVERQQYTPWVAAVWVDPEHRRMGIGAALVNAAAQAAFKLGHSPIYLCANAENAMFYLHLGWELIEEDVGGFNIFKRTRQEIKPGT
jgi:GNAT superfamily N-acetyltransferase